MTLYENLEEIRKAKHELFVEFVRATRLEEFLTWLDNKLSGFPPFKE